MSWMLLEELNLAGGTALALQIGHRTSTDLDFFGKTEMDFEILKLEIHSNFDFRIEQETKNILIGYIEGIKVDFVKYKYELIEPPITEQGIRLLSIKDIGCMKLAAITGRGKKRDFFDLYYILKWISLEDLLDLYQTKYYDGSVQLVLKSLTYFQDADLDEDPFLFENIDWSDIKKTILKEFHAYYDRFS